MSFAGKWMELEITVLSETSQTQKDKYVFSYTWNLEFKKDMKVEGRPFGKRWGPAGGGKVDKTG
jgi:uncharacterized protein affecting Mg2+/Co2+ transport